VLERRRAGAVGELDVRSRADEEAANLGVGFAAVAAGKKRRRSRHGPPVEHVTFNGIGLLSAPREGDDAAPDERAAGRRGRRSAPRATRHVADVGTGSGALAVAIARECPDVELWVTDTSRFAVLLARADVHRRSAPAFAPFSPPHPATAAETTASQAARHVRSPSPADKQDA
jgi:hypothetical protein